MPSYKLDDESESESELPEKQDKQDKQEDALSEDGEPDPDDTFHFRKSFSNKRAAPQDEDMNEASFQTDDEDPEDPDLSYSQMQEDLFSDRDSIVVSEEESQYGNDPLATAVRLEKRATWLEQIEYTDRTMKQLKAIDSRKRLQNTKIHWGGRFPEIKYSTEDLERDLFGDTGKVDCIERG